MAKLDKISGINGTTAGKLKKAGVTTIEKLLSQGSTRQGRKSIAKNTRINEKNIEQWVHHADFFRIKGIAGLKADLPDAVGVNTLQKLSKQKPDKLLEGMHVANSRHKLVERVPGMVQVKRWVSEAKKAKKVVR